MAQVSFLRHAESRYNATRDPERDSRLSARGEEQARALAGEGEYDYAICSPLRRARDTLALSRIRVACVEVSTLARERYSAKSEASWLVDEAGLDGESEADFDARMDTLRALLFERAAHHPRLLCVTHEGVVFALTGVAPDNAELVCCAARELL